MLLLRKELANCRKSTKRMLAAMKMKATVLLGTKSVETSKKRPLLLLTLSLLSGIGWTSNPKSRKRLVLS